jgi:2,6-dihydroxypyridine 3-monooxygenase
MSNPPARVSIMGGSLGGLAAALALRDAGCDVTVYERSPVPLIGLGAGIIVNPATTHYFTSRGICDVAELSVRARAARYLAADGSVAAELPCALRFTSYNMLYSRLLGCFDADRYLLGHAVVDFSQNAGGVELGLADGSNRRCDLLVCADGIRSAARKALVPDSALAYAGYVAWRGTLTASEIHPAIYGTLHDAITYYLLPEGGHFVMYPIPSDDAPIAGTPPLLNWLWYRNVEDGAALQDLMTAIDGSVREVSLPPRTVRQTHIDTLRADAAAKLPPPLAELIRATAHPFLQAIADLEIDAMAFGRVCLIGDAACVARPHVAAGTAKAAEDAWALGAAMAEAGQRVEDALRRWEPGQLALGRSVVARSRRAGERVQFTGEWKVGDALPVGLRAAGDSEMP